MGGLAPPGAGARFQFVGTDPALEAADKAYYEYRAALHAAMDRAGVRDEVLARLLALNAARASAEARCGRRRAGPSVPGRSRPCRALADRDILGSSI